VSSKRCGRSAVGGLAERPRHIGEHPVQNAAGHKADDEPQLTRHENTHHAAGASQTRTCTCERWARTLKSSRPAGRSRVTRESSYPQLQALVLVVESCPARSTTHVRRGPWCRPEPEESHADDGKHIYTDVHKVPEILAP
jgi:hypothetical protein